LKCMTPSSAGPAIAVNIATISINSGRSSAADLRLLQTLPKSDTAR
jgi:hypothetical protein